MTALLAICLGVGFCYGFVAMAVIVDPDESPFVSVLIVVFAPIAFLVLCALLALRIFRKPKG